MLPTHIYAAPTPAGPLQPHLTTMSFPQLDYADYISGDPVRQEAFAKAIAHSFEVYGFATSREFFALPHEEKMKSEHPAQSNPHRGYSWVGQENLSSLTRRDRGLAPLKETKESWDQGANDDELNPNLWAAAESLPGFRPFMEDFFNMCHETEERLLRAVAVGMGLEETHFDDKLTDRVNEFRLTHYPPVRKCDINLESGNQTRTSEHTDFGTITLLFQDSVGGLEVESHEEEGVFHAITASAPTMVVNIVGDSLQRWTNDRLRSTVHRVTIPINADAKEDDIVIPSRYSVVFFGKPNRDVSLYPFPEFLKDKESKYEDITAGEYNQTRLIRVY
ncbi:gibberellin 20-oxidase [Pyrenophora seminiperda CCB06]|uniref:Gibberellin 20-oxidase n=1 Tax=Pyrenophora seminiperda CCB06 TaxID=1302712 RepID=A0A3M7MA25_9PLEO|nr:gibberellin 20-oxidase [Pyrenophora seminiperda CCB06]